MGSTVMSPNSEKKGHKLDKIRIIKREERTNRRNRNLELYELSKSKRNCDKADITTEEKEFNIAKPVLKTMVGFRNLHKSC